MQGAGGSGGLLAAVETNQTSGVAGDDKSYWYLYEANGNVGQPGCHKPAASPFRSPTKQCRPVE
jgi:hypothetical protein